MCYTRDFIRAYTVGRLMNSHTRSILVLSTYWYENHHHECRVREQARYHMIFTTKVERYSHAIYVTYALETFKKYLGFLTIFGWFFLFLFLAFLFWRCCFVFIQFVNIDTLFVGVAVDAFRLTQSIIKYNKLGLSSFLSVLQALRNNSWCSTINYLNKCSYFERKQTNNW